MIEFIFDLLLNVVCFKIGALFIRVISFGRYAPTAEHCPYPYAVAFIGFAVVLVIVLLISFGV